MLAVFNPSPHPRTDVVRFSLDGFPAYTAAGVNPYLRANNHITGFLADGRPVRVVPVSRRERPGLPSGEPVNDLEWIAVDVPAFG